ncbi:MAG: RDD family protein [Actinomycetes bacterium]
MTSLSPRPSSVTGLPPGVEPGLLERRFAAQLIDLLPPAVITAIVLATGAGMLAIVIGAVLLLAWIGLVWWMFVARAAGPGMRVMRLQLVGLSDGRPLGWGRFAVRELVLAALTVSVLGLVLMIVFLVAQRRRQGWHDLVANSVVIKQRVLAPPRARSGGRPAGQQVPRAAVPKPAVPGSGQAAAPADHGSDRERAVALRPGAPPEENEDRPDAVAPAPEPAPTWVAVLDDGRDVVVRSLVLFGRSPEPPPGRDDAELIRVEDGSRTVSKSHLALGLDGPDLYVRDLGSTNGSTVTDFSGVSRPCPPQDPIRVSAGTIVSFGDHWLEIRRDDPPVGSAHAPVGS